jgi:hypothetical protein
MKTPRQMLFDRHSPADRELERIQTRVLACGLPIPDQTALAQAGGSFGHQAMLCCRKFWFEVVLPARHVWAGFAAVWLLMAAVNLTEADHTSARMRSKPVPASVIIAWQEEQKLMAELLNPPSRQAADRPEPDAPQPRSDRQPVWMVG